MSTSFPELQKLWLALQRHPWKTLAVLPAHPGGSGLSAARAILEAGAPYPEAGPLHLVDATSVEEATCEGLLRELKAHAAEGRAVVALASPLERPVGLRVALATDAALLAVTLGDTRLGDAQRTVDLVGHERFLGSVTLPPEKKK
ncbi:hypothetical protein P2318_34375 [Myxococcaceae bacterium GXIMD 01537]